MWRRSATNSSRSPSAASSSALTAAICSAVKNFARLPAQPPLSDVDRRDGLGPVALHDLVEPVELRAAQLACARVERADHAVVGEHVLEDLELAAGQQRADVVQLHPVARVGLVGAEAQQRLRVA